MEFAEKEYITNQIVMVFAVHDDHEAVSPIIIILSQKIRRSE